VTVTAIAAYRVPAFRRYALGQAVSVLGDQVWYVALSWAAVQIASPRAAGAVLAVSSVPRLAFMLFGGVLVDRRGPRELMIHSDVIRAGVAFGAAAIAMWRPSVVLLVVVALVFGIADAVFLPAASALQPRLLEPAQYASGNATTSLVNRAALTLGAPLGGLLVAFGGLPLACVVNAVTFLVSVAALRSLAPVPPIAAPASTGSGLREGLAYIIRSRILWSVLLAGLLCNIGFVGPMNVGLALTSDAYAWGASGIGAMLSGFGIGTIVSGLFVLRRVPQRGVGPIIAACMVLQGISVVVPALTSHLPIAVAATFVAGLTSGPAGILLSAVAQHATDDAFRGRVGSVSSLANLGITPLAMAAMGLAAARFGLVPAFAVSGALEFLGAAVCLAVAPLRRARI
jgi:predicted MFS family arabinose efflux permease